MLDIVVTIFITVLPGRITKMNAILNINVLALKRMFVRYVSHEIR